MHASPEDIAAAVAFLRHRKLVAFPTETVYGLGALALDPEAVDAVFQAKGRPSSNPLIVHVVDEAMARRVCREWTPAADTLARAFWPGPLTLILPKAEAVPQAVTAGGDTVALRCPSHPLTLALLETLAEPIVGPSANRSGRVSPTRPEHVRAQFSIEQVYILDGGPCTRGIESTVVDLTTDPPRVLRPGVITREQLAEALGSPVEIGPATTGTEPARAPGQLSSHYAPSTPVKIIDSADIADHLADTNSPAVVLATDPPAVPPPHTLIEMPAEPDEYAARLYESLHQADAQKAARILVVKPWPTDQPESVWAAIADRLTRAAGPRDA